MSGLKYGVSALIGLTLLGCGGDKPSASPASGGSGEQTSAGAPNGGGSQSTAGAPNGAGGASAAAGTGPGAGGGASAAAGGASAAAGTGPGAGGGSSGTGGIGAVTGSKPSPMPVISHGAPAFASSGADASSANDGDPASHWQSSALPAWLAYNLSRVPVAQRQQVLLAWNSPAALDYINEDPDPGKALPVDYTLEINTAPGGGSAPTSGWTKVATITGNNRSSRQRLAELNGANWVRMNISKSTSPSEVQIDFDVHSAPDGASDSWLFMGDSITFMMSSYPFSDIPELVNQAAPGRWPAVIPAGIGGTNTMTALAAIQNTLADFPGRFVTLNYGTNDHPEEFHMEELVQAVLAAGKVPVVPHMPWSSDAGNQPSPINALIDALYVKYPSIVHGPDFWAVLKGRTDLIPEGDIHPNDAGQEEFRKQWAKAMTQ